MGVKALIINGDGINAEVELANAFKIAGAESTIIHINQILNKPEMIHQFDIIGFPGGFSFGDEIRSGKVFSIKFKNTVKQELSKFIDDKKLIIGICNGFQILLQMGLFDFQNNRKITLAENYHGEFRNFWTKINVVKNQSPWLKGIEQEFFLPVRHKEGRLFGEFVQEKPVLKYETDINGSLDQTAGITDSSGLVFGLMPHPEAAIYNEITPDNIPEDNFLTVRTIFKNAITYSMERQ